MNRGRLMVLTLIWGLVLLTVSAEGLAQSPEATPAPAAEGSALDGTVIGELSIVGLDRIDESYVRNKIRSRAGESYSQDQVQRDISILLRTGRFLDVRAEPKLVEGKVQLVFRVSEKPEVVSIEFVGAQKFKAKDLLEELTFAVGDPLDLYEVRRGRETIETLYKDKGYAYVEVSVDEGLLRSERRVVYEIVENQRVRVRKIRIEGNEAFTNRELKREIETKKYIPIFRTGGFDPDRAERDVALLQKYYRDRGFLDAEVSYDIEFRDVAREKLEVFFRINEGIRYMVGEIRIRGNTVFSEEELLAVMRLTVDDYFMETRLRNDVKKVRTKYGSEGYIDAQVVPSRVFAEEPGQVVVTLTIVEGEQFEVGWIEVNGHYLTQEKCVRRELRFYPEEIYDITKTRAAEKRLKATQLFSAAIIEPMEAKPENPGVRDVLVTIEENERTNQFIAGIGASSDSGILGNFVLENSNFDLFDWPRSWKEFVKGRAFRGAGQTMRFQLEPGTEYARFRIDFREPYLMDKPIGFGTSAYLFQRGRDGYDEERGGGNVSFDKRFEDGWLKGWIGEIVLRAELINVEDRDAFAAEDIRDVDGSNFLTTVKLSLLHDTTDSRFEPSEGHRFRASWEQAAGDFYHSKLTAGYNRHWTVAVDEEERKSVVSARSNIGQILGDSPVFERFYAGGIGSFRGFNYRGISPRDGIRNNRIGGEFMLLAGAEYSFPLYAKMVRGVFFADMGTVEEAFGIKDWRAAVGVGVRLTLPIFGTIPMEFDLAIPVSKSSEDDERVFSFFIGLPFF